MFNKQFAYFSHLFFVKTGGKGDDDGEDKKPIKFSELPIWKAGFTFECVASLAENCDSGFLTVGKNAKPIKAVRGFIKF